MTRAWLELASSELDQDETIGARPFDIVTDGTRQ
jgi:hypothetical protein